MFMDAHAELTFSNKAYLKAVQLYVWEAFKLDHPEADITTRSFLSRDFRIIKAQVLANEAGILAGIQEAEWFLKKLGLNLIQSKKDGRRVKEGDVVLEFDGRASIILGAERTLLNLLQRMSGVATKTKKMAIKMPKGAKLLATRKTLWGLLDKRAVCLGNGGTHRLDLRDAIVIKENHMSLSSNLESDLKRSFKASKKARFLEVELESVEEVRTFLKHYDFLKKYLRDGDGMVVMLDNFLPRDVKKVIKPLSEAGIFVELSGGIHEGNVHRYNIGGIFAISSGSITARAQNLDFSLQMVVTKK